MPRSLASNLLVITVVVVAAARAPVAQTPAPAGQRPVDFAADIQPLLAANCLSCHGEALKLSRLDLRTRDSALEGGAHGPSLVPGSAERSRMYRHVAGLESPAMPMRGEPLSARDVATLKRWIDEGAHWDTAVAAAPSSESAVAAIEERPITDAERSYWAFQPPRQAPLPDVGPAISHPVDRFLEQERRSRGLVARAPRRSPHPHPPGLSRPHRAAADAGGGRAFVDDAAPRRLRAADRHAAGLAALRRALGAGTGSTWSATPRRDGFEQRRRPAQRLALPRLRDPRVQRRQALRPIRRASRSPATRSTPATRSA